MRINVEFIDSKGFWHKEIFKTKSELLKWVKALKKGTEIYWKNKNSICVSQQYLSKEEVANI
jgi:hypothetical protein